MGDVQFAKQFLTSLDNKPTKYQPDHVFDPKTFQMRIPYVLPKLSSPPHPAPPKSSPSAAPAPGAEPSTPSMTLVLKSARNPNMTLTLSSIPSTMPLQALKEQIQAYLGGSNVVNLEKIKLLHNKKPIPGSKKTVSDALDGDASGGEAELGVMIMGGAPDPPPQTQVLPLNNAIAAVGTDSKKSVPEGMEGIESTKSIPVQPGEASAASVLETPEFWNDLQGFLEQRTRSAEEAVRLRGVWERAWRSSRSAP